MLKAFAIAAVILLTFGIFPSKLLAAEVVPGEYVVKYKIGQSPDELATLVAARKNRQQSILGQLQNQSDNLQYSLKNQPLPEVQLAKLEATKTHIHATTETNLGKGFSKIQASPDTANVLANLKTLSNVELADPNYLFHAQAIPNDSYYSFQWNLPKISMPAAWDLVTNSSNVTVAVIDSGVDYTHPDLPTNITKGPDYINSDADPMDDNGHGTFVASLIGAATNNGQGIAGVGWTAKLMAIKVLDSTGTGPLSAINQGIMYAADNGAKVINLSLGGPGTCGQTTTLQSAINYAYTKGVTVIVAAGNANVDAANYSPASCNNVIDVAASTNVDSRASYSNYGAVVDLAAPGGDGSGDTQEIIGLGPDNQYLIGSGTSFSAPQVSAVVALMLARNSGLTPDIIEAQLKSSGDAISTDQYIGKRLNAFKALGAPTPTPSPTLAPTPTPTPVVYTTPPAALGLAISPNRAVDMYIQNGTTLKAFSLTSTGANGFQFYGYPTTLGPGLNWMPSSGGIGSFATNISIQAFNVSLGTYSGVAQLQNLTGTSWFFPVTVRVIAHSPDLNADSQITASDLKIFLQNSTSNNTLYDLDNNSRTNTLDSAIYLKLLVP